ncbi:FIST C-terminal domain-containing protein [uncultured Thiodictyon sp.]|uniref:FIST signal transduction protein n=1 Tax=uncultured Thiodictyon sp. TaxID=1846217 RepID=UPI0025CCAD3A|nr:FIST C-terminal domain-containing protein [uncultured Thiodictyon sp.]
MFEQFALVEARPEAISMVLAQWRQQSRDLGVVVLLPEAEKDQVPGIQGVCRALGLPLIGAVFPALVTNAGFTTQGAWLIGLAPMPPWFLLQDVTTDANAAAARIGKAVRQAYRPATDQATSTLFFIFDAMIPNIGSLLSGVYQDLHDRVRYAGINAGSETFQPMPCLFDRESLVANAVAGLLLPDAHAIVKHGYPAANTQMQAISTIGNRINTINGRPAFEVYQEVIDADFGVRLTRENFYDYAVHFPFGLIMLTEVVVRIPVAFDEDGAIICIGEVPPNSVLRLLRAPALAESDCVAAVAADLKSRSSTTRDTLVTFYCAGRRLHLGAAAAQELHQLREMAGVSQLAGALSLGEISSFEDFGIPVFHNAALVCL